MLKRKNNKDKEIRLLVSVGFFLILLSIGLVCFKQYQTQSNKMQEGAVSFYSPLILKKLNARRESR